MRLTQIMLRVKKPNGHIYRGKTRLVKEVDKKSLAQLRWDYELEEQNMLLLRHPYLTLEQSFGHMKAMGNNKVVRLDWEAVKIEKFTKVVTLADRLMHLRVKDAWD